MRATRGPLVAVARIVGVLGALFALSCFSPLRAQSPARASSLAVRTADIDVVVDSAGHARVRERFTFVASIPSVELERLELPCSTVGDLDLRIDGRSVQPTSESRAPWVRASLASVTDLEISYAVVAHGRELAIPLLLPRAPLTRVSASGNGARRERVVRVRLKAPRGSRVSLPRLAPSSGDTLWSAELIGVPSMLRLATPSSEAAAACGAPLAGDAGDFALLVGCFVGTLAIWVPLYLWWAARRPDASE